MVVTLPVAWIPRLELIEPEKEEEPVPEIIRLEEPVIKPEALIALALKPLVMSREPEKELLAVPEEIS